MVALTQKLNLMALGYAWGDAPGYINVAPLGLCLNAIKLRALHVGLPLQTVM